MAMVAKRSAISDEDVNDKCTQKFSKNPLLEAARSKPAFNVAQFTSETWRESARRFYMVVRYRGRKNGLYVVW